MLFRSRSKLLIGRAEECDVRPLSEDVSRRHCAVHVGPADVWVEDLGSRNGTFVNGVRIKEKTKVATGDLIRVGALELKVSCSSPAAAAGSEEDVSRWLMTDEDPAGMFDTTQRVRTVSVDDPAADAAAESSSIHAEPPVEAAGSGVAAGGSGSDISKSSSALAIEAVKESKAKPGMLPQQPKKASDTSRDAAAEALKKFFGGR